MYTSPRTGTGYRDHRALAAGLNDLQQVIGLLGREGTDEPLVQEFWHPNIADLLEPEADGVAQGTGDVGFSVIGSAFENNVVAIVHKFAGGEAQHLRLVQRYAIIGNLFHCSERATK